MQPVGILTVTVYYSGSLYIRINKGRRCPGQQRAARELAAILPQ